MAGGRLWELDEEELARTATRGELPAIARSLGRTTQAVAAKRLKLHAGPPKRGWSLGEDVRHDRIITNGGTIPDVARALGRSRRSVNLRRHTRRAAGEDIPVVVVAGRVYE